MYVVRVGLDKRLRRLKSGDHQRERWFCGKKKDGSTDGRGKLRLWNMFEEKAHCGSLDFPQKDIHDSHSESVIGFKTEPFKPTDEKDSNVEVTGDPLEPARDAGMFVI